MHMAYNMHTRTYAYMRERKMHKNARPCTNLDFVPTIHDQRWPEWINFITITSLTLGRVVLQAVLTPLATGRIWLILQKRWALPLQRHHLVSNSSNNNNNNNNNDNNNKETNTMNNHECSKTMLHFIDHACPPPGTHKKTHTNVFQVYHSNISSHKFRLDLSHSQATMTLALDGCVTRQKNSINLCNAKSFIVCRKIFCFTLYQKWHFLRQKYSQRKHNQVINLKHHDSIEIVRKRREFVVNWYESLPVLCMQF